MMLHNLLFIFSFSFFLRKYLSHQGQHQFQLPPGGCLVFLCEEVWFYSLNLKKNKFKICFCILKKAVRKELRSN